MKYGVREIANVTFKAKADTSIGTATFKKGQPVLYMDSATTSTLEGAATSVYAQGGRGNTRLVTWEGEKTLTFNVTDALISPISFAMLSGAGVIRGEGDEMTHVHMTTAAVIDLKKEIDLSEVVGNADIDVDGPFFIMGVEKDGSITGEVLKATAEKKKFIIDVDDSVDDSDVVGKNVLIDYYILKKSKNVAELQIDAEHFAGSYYVEADTLWRAQDDGQDYPANITLPNVKIQSNFTFTMASTGDPSTFDFVMDAMPGYTLFDKTKKVLCVIQVVEDIDVTATSWSSVMDHKDKATDDKIIKDDEDGSVPMDSSDWTVTTAPSDEEDEP